MIGVPQGHEYHYTAPPSVRRTAVTGNERNPQTPSDARDPCLDRSRDRGLQSSSAVQTLSPSPAPFPLCLPVTVTEGGEEKLKTLIANYFYKVYQ